MDKITSNRSIGKQSKMKYSLFLLLTVCLVIIPSNDDIHAGNMNRGQNKPITQNTPNIWKSSAQNLPRSQKKEKSWWIKNKKFLLGTVCIAIAAAQYKPDTKEKNDDSQPPFGDDTPYGGATTTW